MTNDKDTLQIGLGINLMIKTLLYIIILQIVTHHITPKVKSCCYFLYFHFKFPSNVLYPLKSSFSISLSLYLNSDFTSSLIFLSPIP